MLSGFTEKKSISPPLTESPTSSPIQQLHSGCHSETKVRKSHGGFVAHVNGRKSPVWAFFPFISAALPRLSAASLWTCGVWNTFQADMGYYNRSSECCASGDERVCAPVCGKWHPSLAEPHLATQQLSQRVRLRPTTSPGVALCNTFVIFCCPCCLFFPMKGQPCHVTHNPPPPVQRCQIASIQVRKQSNNVANHFQFRHSSFGP